jgi:N6-adenosine-specific RNA methylase IME4
MNRYAGMTCEELCNLPVKDIAADNAALFIWTVPPKLEQLFPIISAWGFRYITKAFTWVKLDKKGTPRLLTGYYTGSNTEDCYLAIRGRMPVADKGVRQVVMSQLEAHSKKPDEVRNRIVQLFGDLPRIELFARQKTEGWEALGNEIDGRDLKDSLQDILTNSK